MIGIAYSSRVGSQGIEASLHLEEACRRQEASTTIHSRLLLDCLNYRLRPNWESVRLAEGLGYSIWTPMMPTATP